MAEANKAMHEALNSIRNSILSGEIPHGGKLPTSLQMIKTYGITTNHTTAIRRKLKEEGLIEIQNGGNHYRDAGAYVL